MAKYNGRLLLRIKISQDYIIERNIAAPYEVHIIEFPSENSFDSFRQDEERKELLHIKERAVSSVVLIKGVMI